MLYSSGTAGRPKGVTLPLPDQAFDAAAPPVSWSDAGDALEADLLNGAARG